MNSLEVIRAKAIIQPPLEGAKDDNSRSISWGEKNAPNKASGTPGFDQHIAPADYPEHGPEPTEETTYMVSRQGLEEMLNDCTDAHDEEEATNTKEVCAITHAPESKPMQNCGCEEGAENGSEATHEVIEGATTKVDKVVAEDLVPARGPELVEGGGKPGFVE